MTNLAVIFVCLGLGLLFQRLKHTPRASAAVLSQVVIRFSLPAVTLLEIHDVKSAPLLPVLTPWLVFAAGAALFAVLGRRWGWSRARIGAVTLCAAFGNTSFVGYPLIEALYGREGMPTAVLIDQVGSFPAVAIAGMLVLAFCSGKKIGAADVVRRIVFFPPFLALVAAAALRPVAFAPFVRLALEKMGATLVPLALLSVGLQLKPDLKLIKRYARPLAVGLGYKLVLAPAFIFGLLASRGAGWTLESSVTVAQAAMAPMITGAIMAADAGLEPELAGLLIGVGIPLSLATVPAWAWLLGSK